MDKIGWADNKEILRFKQNMAVVIAFVLHSEYF